MNGQDPEFEPSTWSQCCDCLAGFAFVIVHSVVFLFAVLSVALIAAVLYEMFY